MGPPSQDRLTTGIPGLDHVLGGGFPPARLYLLQGTPGAGKTTFTLQFLREGVRRGERCLYVALAETDEEIQEVARSHGWSLEGLDVFRPSPEATEEQENTLFQPSDVELGERMRTILAEIDRVRPRRMVLDSCSDLRLLAQTALRYRRQIMALKRRGEEIGCAILLVENPDPAEPDTLLQSLVHGVVQLEQLFPLYGTERRRLRVVKLRATRYRGGYHDFVIRTGGLSVFPRLVAAEHHAEHERAPVQSGVPELDAMLGGGLDPGTSVLVTGAAGTGKSVLVSQYAAAAASRGHRTAMFTFDEGKRTTLARAASLGIDLAGLVQRGDVLLQQIDPAELSPGEFADVVRTAVERDGARIVVVDSLSGYLSAMPEERFLVLQLHELLSALGQSGVLTFMTLAQHGMLAAEEAPVDVSYLADAVLLLRYVERGGVVQKVVSVVKKRTGPHDPTTREFFLGQGGVRIGAPVALERRGGPATEGPPVP